uniref:Putative LOV domain-containing protein n=1 Tax=Papaver rhoeas TaxID=33128 RepID=A0A126WYL0_PAPRH|nr:putative LOV domain-containing protein [Papaver rhoeas]
MNNLKLSRGGGGTHNNTVCTWDLGFHHHRHQYTEGTQKHTQVMEEQGSLQQIGGLIESSFNSCYTSWVYEALDELEHNFTITDPTISGHPIVFASNGFLKMTGYLKDEVIGRNGRIFQGPRTNRRSIMEIREAIREEKNISMSLLNYKKDGTPFWMLFQLSPIFSKHDGRVIHFVSVQVPISRRKANSEDGNRWQELVLGSCRREVCSDTVMELARCRALDSFIDTDNRVLEREESCEASDSEKGKALTAIGNIMSVLTHYSELTGRLVCGNRSNSAVICSLTSALHISLGRIKQSFVLTDPQLLNMPIVYASDAFLSMTGYNRHEVLGRNCRFLNGPDTDPKAIGQIKDSIQSSQACSVRILNYRKDRSSFWNFLHISPVRNASAKIAFYVCVQIEEAVKNGVTQGLSPETRQLGTVGAVKVAVRTLSMTAGSSRS